MLTFAVVVIGSYLLGSIPFGYLAGRIAGIDIRNCGSGNVGATNVIRTLRKELWLSRFRRGLLERFRCCEDVDLDRYASAVGMELARDVWNRRGDIELCLGILFPVWLRFKGGKGVATSAGALFGLAPVAALIGVAIWILTFWLTRYVSVASVAAAAALPLIILSYNLAKSNHGKVVILFVGLSRGSCDLASSFKSFAAHAWNGAALYSKVKIGETAILGAGSWGTALAWLWGKDGRQVSLWGHDGDRVARMRRTRENSDYLPGLKLPGSVRVTSELSDCAGGGSDRFRDAIDSFAKIARQLREAIGNVRAVLLSCVKGIEHGTGMRMSQILSELFPEQKVAVLSGPNLAVRGRARLSDCDRDWLQRR